MTGAAGEFFAVASLQLEFRTVSSPVLKLDPPPVYAIDRRPYPCSNR